MTRHLACRRRALTRAGARRVIIGGMHRAEVTPFRSQLPVKIAFGDGVVGDLAEILAAAGARSALVVVEAPVVAHPAVVAALAAAEARGVELERVTKDSGEPTFALAEELVGRIRGAGHGAVVGIGGGSALDVSKAARTAVDWGGSARDLADGRLEPRACATTLVLCPTTSGTGSEVSGAAVLTDVAEDRKIGFGNPLMRAQHALVDPVLTHGLPPGPTAHSGVDAMAQAIAACTVGDGSPLSIAFGLEACHHIGRSLLSSVQDGSDADARRELACGSLTAGLAMNLSDCAADHALGQALGSVKHLPHGLTVGLVLAETLEISRVDCAERLERVADALGEPADGSGDGTRAIRAVRRVLKDVGFPTMRECGVTADDVPSLVEAAVEEQKMFFDFDCHDWSRAEVEAAFQAALAVESR
jgi:alcohol dehydrogenase